MMFLIDSLLLNMILIIFPILLYLFYIIYNSNKEANGKDFLFDISLYSSLYLILKLGGFNNEEPLIIFNAPLIIAYANKRNISILVISILIASYYITFFNTNPLLIIIEYVGYYLLYLYLSRREFKWYLYIDYFIIIKSLFIAIFIFSDISYLGEVKSFIKVFGLILILYTTTYFAVYLFNKGKDIIRVQENIRELEKEKEIRTSLFKITHEIKNPIAVCKGYLDMFDVNDLDHSHRYIPIIKEEISRVLVLLQDFLSIGRIKLECDIMDINMMLEDVTNSLRLLLNSNNIFLINEIEEDEIYINGDYNRLSQVMINIIKNSIEASKDSNSYIKIKSKLINNNYHIVVEDNGYGITEENLKHISELFYTTKINGTGMGIHLSKEIIEAHNGTIKYNSKENEGTRVEIILPYDFALNK